MTALTHLTADLGVPHGFFGRTGGVSHGLYDSLNVGLGTDDDIPCVVENRLIASRAVRASGRLLTAYQIHSSECVTVLEPFQDTVRPHADALVTDRPGLLLGVLTADCAPVLFADTEAGIIGAAHAGWKGALAGVIDTTVLAMEAIGARRERITAAVGPCIAQASYEVDDEFRARFVAQDGANDRFFADARAGHARFDLEGYVAGRLAAAGITRVILLGRDTVAEEDAFYSHRRATLRGEPASGRQISIIALD